jgi:hypothetical protein
MKPVDETATPQAQSETLAAGRDRPRRRLQIWPALAGIALAALVAFDLADGREAAPILAASGLVYLGAAALERRAAAWPLFLVTFIVIAAASAGWLMVDATWALIGLAFLLAAYGLLRGALRPRLGLPLQAIAMVLFGGAAAVALYADPVVGACLVAAGLLGHAAWDFHHHRTGRVVTHSLAEFCFVLDVLVAMAILIVTFGG